ncbi:MAG: glycosyltransferase, partial [Candidatus Eremiobacterota bacterium]
NYYQQPGGEDTVFRAERDMLRQYGHTVIEYTDHNDRIKTMSPLSVARDTIWSGYSYNRIMKILKEEKPDIAHFHNTFPLISTSAYYACKKMKIPVVQTLHNYRLLCPAAIFYREGHICEECIGHKVPIYKTIEDYRNFAGEGGSLLFPYPAVIHSCYHKSRFHSAMVAMYLFLHRMAGTWQNKVDAYIALTEFSKKKFIEGGLPEKKIFVKPNFVHPDPGMREGSGDYALFVGRLSPEKGIMTLLMAWKELRDIPLKITGDGPLMEEVREFVRINEMGHVEILGNKSKSEVIELMKKSKFLVFPSEWYETFGMVAIEASACGVPVIASYIGSLSEIMGNLNIKLYFIPDNPDSIKLIIKEIHYNNKEIIHKNKFFRLEYEGKYKLTENLKQLVYIYKTSQGKL